MRFRNEYYFLSNMYPCPVDITINGKTRKFCNAEAAFQAMKNPTNDSYVESLCAMSGYAAKRAGQSTRLRPDWESVKDDVMRQVLTAKFTQNPELMENLQGITREIREDNDWNDRYWGVCNGTGQNKLGKLLMELRD